MTRISQLNGLMAHVAKQLINPELMQKHGSRPFNEHSIRMPSHQQPP